MPTSQDLLVLCQNSDIEDLLALRLRAIGRNLVVVRSFAELLLIPSGSCCGAIIVDPFDERDIAEVVGTFRKTAATGEAPIVVLTPSIRLPIEALLGSGVEAVFSLPASFSKVAATLASALTARSLDPARGGRARDVSTRVRAAGVQPVSITFGATGEQAPGRLVDLGRGGLCLATTARVPAVGEILAVYATLNANKLSKPRADTLDVEVVVRWLGPEEGQGASRMIGCEFVGSRPDVQTTVLAYINDVRTGLKD